MFLFVAIVAATTLLPGCKCLYCGTSPKVDISHKTVGSEGSKSVLTLTQLSYGSSACFWLENDQGEKKYFAVTFTKLHGTASYGDNTYEFGIPTPKAVCKCQCDSSVLGTCSIDDGYCNSASASDRCINKKSESPNSFSCVGGNPTYCCELLFERSTTMRYKGVQVRENEFEVGVTISEYSDRNFETEIRTFDELGSGTPDGSIFTDVDTTADDISEFLDQDQWFILDPTDTDKSVHVMRSKELNNKNEYNIERAGWIKVTKENGESLEDPGEFQFKTGDNPTDEEIKNILSVTECKNDKAEALFPTPDTTTFPANLEPATKLDSTVLKRVTWEEQESGHGIIKMEFWEGVEELRMRGDFDLPATYKVAESFEHASVLGSFTAGGIITKEGEKYLQINTTETLGELQSTLTLGTGTQLEFRIEVQKKTRSTTVYRNSLLSCGDQENLGQLCLSVAGKEGAVPQCQDVMCKVEEIAEADSEASKIDTVIEEEFDMWDPMDWLALANPAKWFDGKSSWQERVMIFIVIVLFLLVAGLVVKLLRAMRVLKTCLHYTFCCCLCKSFEGKVLRRVSTVRRSVRKRTATMRKSAVTFESDVHKIVRSNTVVFRKAFNRMSRKTRVRLIREISQENIMDEKAPESEVIENKAAKSDSGCDKFNPRETESDTFKGEVSEV